MECLAHSAGEENPAGHGQPEVSAADFQNDQKDRDADRKSQAGDQERRKHSSRGFDHQSAEAEYKRLQDQIEIAHLKHLWVFDDREKR